MQVRDEQPAATADPFLRTGEQYRESLRDGRHVIDARGEEVPDVTAHPDLAAGIDTLAELYDAQFDPATRDLTTYVDEETGNRTSLAWKPPRTLEDLEQRRSYARFSTYQTLGVFGRPPDYGSMNSLGLLSIVDKIDDQSASGARTCAASRAGAPARTS